MFRMVDLGGFFFSGLWDLVEDNSEEKPFVAILSMSIHIMPGLTDHMTQPYPQLMRNRSYDPTIPPPVITGNTLSIKNL